jgi:hypothetical protein
VRGRGDIGAVGLALAVPGAGQLIPLRERRRIVRYLTTGTRSPDTHPRREAGAAQRVVRLVSIDADGFRDDLHVVWELEPGRQAWIRCPVGTCGRPASTPLRAHARLVATATERTEHVTPDLGDGTVRH